MKAWRSLLCCTLMAVLASASGAVWARDNGLHGFGLRQSVKQNAIPRPQRGPQAQREAPQQAPQNRAEEGAVQRPGRLTPEERQALRQQINDARHDVYSAPAPHK